MQIIITKAMKTNNKYYILKRNTNNIGINSFRDLSQETAIKIQKRLDFTKPIILAELQTNPDGTQLLTNMWTLDES